MIREILKTAITMVTGVEDPVVEYPANLEHGDYSTNVAMVLFPRIKHENTKFPLDDASDIDTPYKLADLIAVKMREDKEVSRYISKIEAVAPGFINFFVENGVLISAAEEAIVKKDHFGSSKSVPKKIMVEYGHPNTHKELHIGHMRTLVVGESLARILGFVGAEVFRANYQGDIGPHVAKAIWGTRKLLHDRGTSWEDIEKTSVSDRAHLLGQGYALGNTEYEENKDEITELNKALYAHEPSIQEDYERTRRWSLEYYDTFYKRFDTAYDKLYFESEVADDAITRVRESLGTVFVESEGAVIYDGEAHGLHKRVFITKEGYPTYEGKDIALAFAQFSDFAFDLNIHIVASEQKGYFEVVFDALKQIDRDLGNREYHLSMGMVQLVGRKMSSRTGDVFTVDQLLDEVKEHAKALIKVDSVSESEKEEIAELSTMAAVKYSVLSASAVQDVLFDAKKSVALDGNSGPYLQYTFARTQSVLARASTPSAELPEKYGENLKLSEDELRVLRGVQKFPEVVKDAAENYSPHIICNYLYSLAQEFNTFYANEKIIGSREEAFRLVLTQVVGQTIKNGLHLLGIKSPKRM